MPPSHGVSSGLNARRAEVRKQKSKSTPRAYPKITYNRKKEKGVRIVMLPSSLSKRTLITAVHFMMSSSIGAPVTPCGGSLCNRRKSRIKRRRAGVLIRSVRAVTREPMRRTRRRTRNTIENQPQNSKVPVIDHLIQLTPRLSHSRGSKPMC